MAPVYEEELLYGIFSTLLAGVPSGLLSLASYVLTALALYTLADRRGLNKPWLAWIPVVNCWILGSLSDQYQYVVRGENKSKRKWLLGLNIVMALIGVFVAVLGVMILVGAINTGIYGGSGEAILSQIMGPVVAIVGLCLPLIGVAIASAVLYFMALYDVYKSMDPSNSVLFLVLSILFNVTEPFFLFFNRHKDKGMPPRRQEPSYIPKQPQYEQTWEPENKDYL